MRALGWSLRDTAKLLSSHRRLWIPFFVTFLVEAFFIAALWLAPQPPFSTLLAPPIRYFSGERVLHYPWHLWYIYHSMKNTNMLAATLVGAYMTGVACIMVKQAHEGRPISMREALLTKQVRYLRVVILWLITWGLAKASGELLTHVAPKSPTGFWIGVSGMVVLQSLLVYAIPSAVFEGVSWWRALVNSVKETMRHPVSTLVITVICNAVIIAFGVAFSEMRLIALMRDSAPELAFAFIGLRLVVWTIVDTVLTVGVSHLWLYHRDPQVASSVAGAKAVRTRRGVGPVKDSTVTG